MELQTNNAMEVEQQAKEEVFFELGDFAYESDGSVLVAYTNKDMASSVQIYKVCAVFIHLTISDYKMVWVTNSVNFPHCLFFFLN